MPELQTRMTGIASGESPRWHDDRLWFSDWGAEEPIAVDVEGNSEVIVRVPSFPFSIDWLPDGRLLIVSARDRALLTMEPNGSLATHTDLAASLTAPPGTRSSCTVEATPTSTAADLTLWQESRSPPESSRWSPPTARVENWPTASPSPMAWR